MDQEALMRLALEEAQAALSVDEIPVGAVVSFGGEAVSLAHNEREALCDPTAHAEVLALRRAAKALGRRRLDGCTLTVTLEPCAMCAGAALAAGVDRIVYGAPDPKAGCAGSIYTLPEDGLLGGRTICSGGLLQREGKALLDQFFMSRRKERE